MIPVESIIEEFAGRIEAPEYLEHAATDKIDYDVFETVGEHQRLRAQMLLSALKGYQCEPKNYHYDPENNEILLEYDERNFIAVISLVTMELSN